MDYISIEQQPGTSKAPQTTELATTAFTQTNRVHFPDGRMRTIPAWTDATPNDEYIEFIGGCRAIFGATLSGDYAGNYYLFGCHNRLYCRLNGALYNITPLVTTATATLGADPLATTNGSNVLTVTYTAHGLVAGDRIKLDGATDVGGITAATDIDKEFIVATATDANTFTVIMEANATSDATGGGSAIDIYKQIAAGNLDQGIAEGFGAGLFGGGLFGEGTISGDQRTYPRIWSFDNFGNEIVMCPGDYIEGDGQKIYIWDGNLEEAPSVLSGAPDDCNWLFVVNNAIVALCGTRMDISSIGDGTSWTPGVGSTAFTVELQRVWKLIGGRRVSDKAGLVFTPSEVIYLSYIGEPDYWDLSDLTSSDGLIAPQASCVIDGTCYWRGNNGRYRWSGSSVEKIANDQNEDYFIANTNYGQSWKCFYMPDPQNGQVWDFAPLGDDDEPSDYNIYNYLNGSNTLGELSRTAAQLPGFIGNAYYMAYGDSATEEGSIYRHFVDNPDLDLGWSATTAYAYAGDGSRRFRLLDYMPDNVQEGDITLEIFTKDYMQGSETAWPAVTITPSTEHVTVTGAGRLRKLRFSGQKAATIGLWKEGIRTQGRR